MGERRKQKVFHVSSSLSSSLSHLGREEKTEFLLGSM